VSIWNRLDDVPRWLVYTLLVIVTVTPVLRPVPLSVEINESHQKIYDLIDALQPGDAVLLSVEYDSGVMGDQHPPYVAMVKHLIKKDARAVFVALAPEGAVFAEKLVNQYIGAGKEYGIDVVNLGYVPGQEAAVAALADRFSKAVLIDHRGYEINKLPLINEVQSIQDTNVVVVNTSGGIGPVGWVRQVYVPYKKPIAMLVASVMMPATLPYYQAGQLVGVGSGFRFAAEYETLLGEPGPGMAGMAAQTFSHFYFISLVVLGNLARFVLTRKEQGVRQ
jgi:hypothetical protein